MRIGGYKIIDLQNVNLSTDTPVTLKNIHNNIENSYFKPLLLSGIKIDNVEYNNMYFTYSVTNNNFIIKNVYGFDLTISTTDEITISAVV